MSSMVRSAVAAGIGSYIGSARLVSPDRGAALSLDSPCPVSLS